MNGARSATSDGHGGDLISELRDVNPRAQALVLSAGLDPRRSGARSTTVPRRAAWPIG
jgi:hypothetical protein